MLDDKLRSCAGDSAFDRRSDYLDDNPSVLLNKTSYLSSRLRLSLAIICLHLFDIVCCSLFD